MTDAELDLIVWVIAAAKDGRAREIRQAAGLSQAVIAAQVDVTPVTVCLWENARRTPRVSAPVLKYARLLRQIEKRLAEPRSASASIKRHAASVPAGAPQ